MRREWSARRSNAPPSFIARRALIYVGDAPKYREFCDEVAAHDYEGFDLD